MKEKAFYLFDMDGTLTPARLPMTDKFADWFRGFIIKNEVFIASGSDIGKIKSQVPQDIFEKVSGVYASMGNELYHHGKKIYEKEFVPETKLLNLLEGFRKNTKYTKLFPNYIEKRCGMINFSVLGRDCPHEERVLYKIWDDKNFERAAIQKKLQSEFAELDITLGGNISMDIVPKGYGKEQVADHLRKNNPGVKIIFVGDRTEEGGNDYSLAQHLLTLGNAEIVSVSGPDDIPAKLANIV